MVSTAANTEVVSIAIGNRGEHRNRVAAASDRVRSAYAEALEREQAGGRPAVIVSADLLNESHAGIVIVVPCTTTRRGLPSHIELDAASGLDEISYAKCEDIKSVSDERLIVALGAVPVDAMFEIARSIRFLLDA